MERILLIICAFFLTGCVSISPQQRLVLKANWALTQTDYPQAMKIYEAALTEAKANNDKQYQAIAMYGLGRANGYLCNYEKAEEWFLKSITLRETIPDSRDAYLSQNLLELARLYKSAGQYNKANTQFEKAVPLLENLNIERSDPIGYAKVLEDYVFTLEKSGSIAKSEEWKNQIKKLKNKYPNKQPYFIAQQYPSNCK